MRRLVQRSVNFLLASESYVAHRLSVAGGDPELFTPDAVRMIWSEAKGVPRIINTLCDLSLVYAFSASLESVDADIVGEVLTDREKMGLQPAAEPNAVEAGIGIVK